jgi:hypothetical protein
MQLNSDFSDLLSALARHRVRYLIVGGWAVGYHAEPRYTKDLDIFVAADLPNCRRLQQALEAFAGPLPELHLLKSIDGVRFETAWHNRVRVRVGSVSVNLISRKDLIRNKRASGRAQDLLDLSVLRRR